ncbi:hypothetical protein [Clostridium ihumii]|uniref:hypothetical protein n=1 Tax=Clostridium ihumii TaxID=1470356 RepID=UPI000AFA578C|nr:hypothetical protein [Clostridium ihumii]
MLLECKITGEQNEEKAAELLREAIETLLKNGGIKLENVHAREMAKNEGKCYGER